MPRHGALSLAGFSLLVATGCSLDSHPFESTNCVRPAFLSQSVSGRSGNVLSGLASATTRDADSVVARFGITSSVSQSSPFSIPVQDSVRIPILGLAPEARYEVQLSATNRCGSTTGEMMSFTTGSLPADLPAYDAVGPAPDSGYIAFGAGNYGIVINNTGRVVWYHRFTNGPGLNFQAQPNGRYAARPNAGPGKAGTWMREHPVQFAGVCGLVIAAAGIASGSTTYGSGYEEAKSLLDGKTVLPESFDPCLGVLAVAVDQGAVHIQDHPAQMLAHKTPRS